MAEEMVQKDLFNYLIPGSDKTYYIPNFVSEDEEAYLLKKIQETPQNKWRQLANRRLQTWGGDLTPKNTLIPQSMPPFLSSYPDIISRIEATGIFKDSPHRRPNHVILNEYLPGQGIMPHEDGPSYHPVVATLSLGSHAVFHYYRYQPSSSQPADDTEGDVKSETSGRGRIIDRTPALTILLEPRSLVITTSSLYMDHLHGIDNITDDAFAAHTHPPYSTDNGGDGQSESRSEDAIGVCVANVEMLEGEVEKRVVREGGVLSRGTRYSLTCRDVGKVASIGTGKMFGRR